MLDSRMLLFTIAAGMIALLTRNMLVDIYDSDFVTDVSAYEHLNSDTDVSLSTTKQVPKMTQ